MTVDLSPTTTAPVCVNHPKRETGVRCGKCGDPICPRCMVQTPVGMRCKRCAQLRRLPQYDVSPWLLLRSWAAGLLTSLVGWYLTSAVPYLRFFLAVFVGVAVAEVMSRLALRRDNLALEAAAVVDIVAGFLVVEVLFLQSSLSAWLSALGANPAALLSVALPVVLASFIAVIKLR